MPKLVLGIDIGGTKIAYALAPATGADGAPTARWRRPTEPSADPRDDVHRMADDARRLLAEAGASPNDLTAIGVSAPGPLDAERARVLHPPNLPAWGDLPLRDLLRDDLQVPVFLENDANAAAVAEWRHGAGQGLSDLVYLTMSTGVGGGLIVGGALQRGSASLAGELGHVPVEWDGETCHCGQRGCLEAYVGGACWTERLREIAPLDSRVTALAGGREHITPEHVVTAAREGGDAFAQSELNRFNHYLARAVVQISFALAPQAILLGTIAVAAGEALCLGPVSELARARLWPPFAERLALRPAALGSELPYWAGVCVARLEMEGAQA